MTAYQVAVKLDSHAFETLKRIAAADKASYAVVISHALAAWEQDASPPLAPASPPTSAAIIYAELSNSARQPWRKLTRELRTTGLSYAAIGKALYREHDLCGSDHFPLGSSTIRGMLAQ